MILGDKPLIFEVVLSQFWLAPLMLWLRPPIPLPLRLQLDADLILLALEPLGLTQTLAEVIGASSLHHFGLSLSPLQGRC
jgi:hypothetical protein